MLDGSDSAKEIAEAWLAAFNAGEGLFDSDCHWRDLVALTGEIRTQSGIQAAPELRAGLAGAVLTLDVARLPPRSLSRAGRAVIEAVFTFNSPRGPGEGVVRLLADTPVRAWTVSTALAELPDRPVRTEEVYARDVRAPNWADNRAAAVAYADRDPQVLVVGGGHAGLSVAAYLGAMGLDTLVVDRETRIGDNWRLRYHNLKLHNQIGVNQLPFLPFPPTWPRYIPKDQIANWLELYTEALEINFWTETSFEGAEWCGDHWEARVIRAGQARTFRPRHIIMAASVSAVPKRPDIPSLDAFGGTVLHSSEFEDGAPWSGRPVMVLGTGTSAHDICQHLHAHGAEVTMVQRSPTMVVNVEPSAQLYDGLYLGDGPPIEDRDLLNTSFPLDLIKRAHQIITRDVREREADFYQALERAGFRLEWGEDDTGWPLKYRTRGGGYYFNVGCSELLISGEVDLIQYHDIEAFTREGVRMKDGTDRPAALVVTATGYEGQGHLIRSLFGEDVAERAGPVWGFNSHQEMANMWTRTGQPGLWFTAGAFSQCRIYGKYLAQQIALAERER